MSRARLLLLEDDASIRRFVNLALGELPVEIVEATSIAAASEALGGERFAMLIADLMLPDGNGMDLVARIRADPQAFGPVRTVIFSAGVSAALRDQAGRLGVWRVLDKPVSVKAIVQCVSDGLGEHAPPASSSAEPAPVAASDLTRQQAIDTHFDGQAALFDAFKAACCAELPADLDAADLALRRDDVAALRRVAHNLKTALSLIGHNEAASRARALEQAAARGDGKDELDRLWRELRPLVQAVR